MKTRLEMANIACMTSAEVTGVLCTFELPSLSNRQPKAYLYKCPTALAEALTPGMLVLADYQGEQASNRDRPCTPVLVKEVLHSFDPEDMKMQYRWIFAIVDLSSVDQLTAWELETTDTLLKAQRRRTRDAVLREIVGEGFARPQFPLLASAKATEDFEVVETVDQPTTLHPLSDDNG